MYCRMAAYTKATFWTFILFHNEIKHIYFVNKTAAAAKPLQSCPTLCDPHRWQPTRLLCPWDSPGRILEWVAISFSNAWKWKVKVKSLSRIQLLATTWTAAYQAPTSMGFSRQEYWLLLLLSRFSHVRLCATPETAAHQALLSLGFSRQEPWSGLPVPSPMHENEKWKWSRSVVSDSQWPHGLQPTRLPHPWDFLGKSTGVGCHCLLWEYWSGVPLPSVIKLLPFKYFLG